MARRFVAGLAPVAATLAPPASAGWPARVLAGLRAAMSWCGPGENRVTLGRWLVIIVGSWLVARALLGVLPEAILLPPMLALSVAYATARAMASRLSAPHARLVRRAEMPAVLALAFLAAWAIFGFLAESHLFIQSADNQFLSARAMETAKGLAEGRWARWTHMLEGGDSLVDFYPMGVTMAAALGELAMGVRSTNILAVWTVLVVLTWVLRGVAAYHLARRFAHPLIALAIAAGACLEIGSDVWDGVWNATIFFGMVSSNVALSLGALATSYQIDLCRRVTGPRVVACAALFALASLVHPLGALLAMISGASLLITLVFRAGARQRGLWAVAATLLGMCTAGFWLVPFGRALGSFGFNQSWGGLDYLQTGKGLLDGSIPVSSFAAFTGFGLVALTAALTTRRLSLVAQALCASLFWLMTISPFMLHTGLFDTFPGLLDGQLRRMLTVVKTVAIPALAWMMARAYRHLQRHSTLRPGAVLWRALLLTVLVFGPGRAIAEGAGRLALQLREQVGRPEVPGQLMHTGDDHIKAFAWLEAQRRADPSPTPWRLALHWPTRWRHAIWADAFRLGIPVVDYINIVGQFFSNRPRERTVQGFHDWNIKYAMTDYPTAPAPGLTPIYTAGGIYVWQVPDYDDRFVVAPDGVRVQDLKLEGDSIRFVVEGAPPGGADLLVRCAWLPRWRATVNGERVPVVGRAPRPDAKPKQEQIAVHVGNGTVELTCDGAMPGLGTGIVLSLLSLAGLALASRARGREIVAALLQRLLEAARRSARRLDERLGALLGNKRKPALVLAALVLVLALFASGRRRLSYPPIEGVGLDVYSSPSGEDRFSRCAAQWWTSEYRCAATETRVIPGMALTTPHDDSGEFGTQHPGIRVELGAPGSRTELRFSGVRARGALHLVTSFWGTATIEVRVGQRWLTLPALQGDVDNVIPVPEGLASVTSVVLRLKAVDDHAIVTLAARFR